MYAIGLALLGFFSFTLMDLSIKWSLQTYSLFQVTFFNCTFAILGLLIWIYPRFELLKTKQPWVHVARALTVLLADLLAFYSYGKVPLAEAYTLILTMPLFTALFAFLLQQEQVKPRTLILTAIGFAGVYLTLNPQFGHLQLALLAALASAIIESLGFLLIARYRTRETPQSFAVYSLSLMTFMTGIYTVFNYQPLTLSAIGVSLGGGLCYALASALVITAFHRGSPTAISSMQYSQLVWGMLLGFILWQELPSTQALWGGCLVTCAGLGLLYTQHKTRQAPQTVVPESVH